MTERGVCVRPLNQRRHRGRHARCKGMEGRGLGLMARSYQRHRPCGVDSSLLCLFIVYPVYRAFTGNGVNETIMRNTRINTTGQADLDPRSVWEVDCE